MSERTVLVLGVTGMLGHTLFRAFSTLPGMQVHATARNRPGLDRWFSRELLGRIHAPADADDFNSILDVMDAVRPDVVINCIGVIKQLAEAKDPLTAIAINSLLPHRLAKACERINARLIHLSTDCVFSGTKGGYQEGDFPDCTDLYGRSKLLGEVDYPHAITLRTSIIGHELFSRVSLVDWFLSQRDVIKGFTRARYSGFPTVEMARIIAEQVIPRPELSGLYHLSSEPISKYDLLCLVRDQYGKEIEIEPDADFCCDRSLDSSRFRSVTGYDSLAWPVMVKNMYEARGHGVIPLL
jgi:dTDP-4-dehydrorhamnose reductase